ncbi:hypothetical protein [Streptomyces sp. YIM S03343]
MNPASTPASPDPEDSGASGHPGNGDDGRTLSASEHEEYERLRRHASVRHRRLRNVGASILLLLALLLAPVAVVAAWVEKTVTDTDRYVATVAPLASDPAVQNVIITRITNHVVAQVDVKSITDALAKTLKDRGAPPRVVAGADALTGPLTSAVRTAVDRVVTRVITSNAFQQVWEGANRRAHAAVMKVLTDEGGGVVSAKGENIQLDVGQIVDQVRTRLVDAGFSKAAAIPNTDKTITLFKAKQLSRAQDAMRLLDIMGAWLPVIAVAFAALAVWTAPSHRLMLMIAAIGMGVMMIVLLVGLAVARRIYLDSVPSGTLPPDAAAAIYDTFIRFLRNSTRTLLVVFVITALAAYLFGPGRVARFVRATSDRGTTAAGNAIEEAGLRTGTVGRWLDGHRAWTTGGVIAAGVLALLLWNTPTVGVVALIVGLVLVVLIILAILAAAAGPPPEQAEEAAT